MKVIEKKKYTVVKPWLVTPNPMAEIVDQPGAYTISDCNWIDRNYVWRSVPGPWSLYMKPDGNWVSKDEYSECMHEWSSFSHLPEMVEIEKVPGARYSKTPLYQPKGIISPRDGWVTVTPCGHPRCLVHFPDTIPKTHWWGEPTECKALARNVNYRTDNGPAYNKGPVEFQFHNDLRHGAFQVGTHHESGMFQGENRVGEIIEVLGEIPPAPVPGNAYPSANRHNPARVGGGYCDSHGEWTEVTVKWLRYWPVLSDIWHTRGLK